MDVSTAPVTMEDIKAMRPSDMEQLVRIEEGTSTIRMEGGRCPALGHVRVKESRNGNVSLTGNANAPTAYVCSIYPSRPSICRSFACHVHHDYEAYLSAPSLYALPPSNVFANSTTGSITADIDKAIAHIRAVFLHSIRTTSPELIPEVQGVYEGALFKPSIRSA